LEFEIFVDGGIRSTTAPILADAGADGIVPGSLVFGAPDPIAIVRWIHSLRARDGKLPIDLQEMPAVRRLETVVTL
jgi:ribulose-phosphate 3-epimerase